MTTTVFVDGRVFGLEARGGVSRVNYEWLKALSGRIHFHLFHGFYQDMYDWSVIRLDRNDGVRRPSTIRGLGRLSLVMERPWMERCWRASHRGGCSIFHATYYRIPRSLHDARLLVCDYDCIHERFPAMFRDTKEVLKRKRHAFNHADAVVTISESSKQDLIEFYGLQEDKIRVAHLGVSSFFRLPEEKIERGNSPYLLYVGSRATYKNFAIVERFFRESMTDMDLIVVGGPSLEECRWPGGGRRLWVRADDERLRSLYWGACALIYPSMYEGFGLPPLEALACGCPVVASDIPVLREVLGEHAEYFCCSDVDDLEAAVNRALGWTEKRRLEGHNHAKTFTWERSASVLQNCYRQLS